MIVDIQDNFVIPVVQVLILSTVRMVLYLNIGLVFTLIVCSFYNVAQSHKAAHLHQGGYFQGCSLVCFFLTYDLGGKDFYEQLSLHGWLRCAAAMVQTLTNLGPRFNGISLLYGNGVEMFQREQREWS